MFCFKAGRMARVRMADSARTIHALSTAMVLESSPLRCHKWHGYVSQFSGKRPQLDAI